MNDVPEAIRIDAIRIDGGTQSRSSLNEEAISDYALAIADGIELPPITIFFDGAEYWLADGFHRYHAHMKADEAFINAEVISGTRRDAILHSVGANCAHGLRRTNDDKRRAVLRLLEDAEWANWSDREIARRCRVGHPLVASLRPRDPHTGISSSMDRTFTHPKTGQPSQMRTDNIGSTGRGQHETPVREVSGRSPTKEAPRELEEPVGDAEFNPMAARPFVPKDQEALPTAEEMRAAVLTLSKLQPPDFIRLSDPRKRPELLRYLAHLIEVFERVREEIGE